MLITMIPISFNGIGVREWAAVTLYGTLGISSEEAVALTLSVYLLTVFNSLLGGMVFLLMNEERVAGAFHEDN